MTQEYFFIGYEYRSIYDSKTRGHNAVISENPVTLWARTKKKEEEKNVKTLAHLVITCAIPISKETYETAKSQNRSDSGVTLLERDKY